MITRSMIILAAILLIQTINCEDLEVKTEPPNPVTPTIDRSSHQHYESPTFNGFWKKKFLWRPRWVKTWQEKKIYVAVWKRMWGPAVVKEWVPVPKPPPGWVKSAPGAHFVKIG